MRSDFYSNKNMLNAGITTITNNNVDYLWTILVCTQNVVLAAQDLGRHYIFCQIAEDKKSVWLCLVL